MFKVLAMIIAMATGHVAKAAPVEVSYDAVLAPVLSTKKLHGGDHCDGRGHSDDHGRGPRARHHEWKSLCCALWLVVWLP